MEDAKDLQSLLSPQSIAVVGASRSATSVGTTILANILEAGFTGSLYPVNPNADKILNLPVYHRLADIPTPVDLALIVVPAAVVPAVLTDAGKKGVKYAVVISSGFKESGDDGAKKEEELKKIAKNYHIRILGPNCLGIMAPHNHLNASFARTPAIAGSIALLSQSGAMGSSILDFFRHRTIGLSQFVSVGNEADLSILDFIPFCMDDPHTSTVGIYMEQIPDANTFISLIQKLRSEKKLKPIVVLKAGITDEGSKAAKSHTGAITGSAVSGKTLFTQAGIIETHSTEEFMMALITFSTNPDMTLNTLTIVTNAGGPGIVAVDTALNTGLTLAHNATIPNPRDLLGDATPQMYKQAIVDSSNDEAVGSILSIVTPQTTTDITGIANSMGELKETIKKPFVVCPMGETAMQTATDICNSFHITVTPYPEAAVAALAHMWQWHTYQKQKAEVPIQKFSVDTELKNHAVSVIQSCQQTYFNGAALELMKAYGLTIPKFFIAKTKQEAVEQSKQLSNSIAMKVLSADIIHKTDIGGILLNITTIDVEKMFDQLMVVAKTHASPQSLEGILLMNMVPTHQSVEMIMGAKKEKGIGTLIMLGLGGTYVELLGDVSYRFAPLTSKDASDMIDELKIKQLFSGFRGKPPLDKPALVDALCRFSQLVGDVPEIREIEVNPVIVGLQGQGVSIVDARLIK